MFTWSLLLADVSLQPGSSALGELQTATGSLLMGTSNLVGLNTPPLSSTEEPKAACHLQEHMAGGEREHGAADSVQGLLKTPL